MAVDTANRQDGGMLDSGRGFAWLIGLYVVAALALRLGLFPAGSQDDSEQLLFSQVLAGGYNRAQPPLYTWLVYLSQALFGVSVEAVVIVKFAALSLVYAGLYGAARLALADRRLAAYAALAPIAIYYVGWDALLNYSNSVLMAAACAVTLWAVLALDRRPSLANYAGLGVALAFGFLSKYAYGVFAGALLIAALADPVLRRRLGNRRIALSLAIAVLLLLPHLLWIVETGVQLDDAFRDRLRSGAETGYWAAAGSGLLKLANGIVAFPFPLYLLLPALFPRACRPLRWRDPTALRHKRLLERFVLAALAILVIGILGFGVSQVRTHYLFVLLPVPLYFFLRVQAWRTERPSDPGFGMRWYPWAIAALAGVALVGLGVKFALEPRWCKRCYLHMPYAELSEGLRRSGFEGGTMIVQFHRFQIAGNLRPYFPESRILSTKYPYFRPPLVEGPCLLVWDPAHEEDLPAPFLRFAEEAVGATVLWPGVLGSVQAPLLNGDGRTFRLRYERVTGGACR